MRQDCTVSGSHLLFTDMVYVCVFILCCMQADNQVGGWAPLETQGAGEWQLSRCIKQFVKLDRCSTSSVSAGQCLQCVHMNKATHVMHPDVHCS